MVREYWRQIHRRALADTVRVLHLESRGRLVIALAGVIAALSCLFFWGSADASRDELIVRLAIAGFVIFLFPFVYLWKFLEAPARIRDELETELNARISDLEQRITALGEEVKPRLAFGRLKDDLVFDTEGNTTTERKYLEIRNTGNEMLEKCLAVVEAIEFDDGTLIEPQAALATTARDFDGTGRRFSLGPGIPKHLVFISREIGNPRAPGFHKVMLENHNIPLNRGKSGLIQIAAGGEIGAPTRLKLRFAVDEEYKLTLEPVVA
jgi:hypothetical protein